VELGDRIATELAAAHARHPEAAIDDAAFVAAIHVRLAAQKDVAAALARLRVGDLFLAQWCAAGDPRAIGAFERAFADDLDAVLARFRRLPLTEDELRQALRIKLFVGASPRIGNYAGFGYLQNWLRVTALRAMVDLARSEKARKLEELIDDDFAGIAAPSSPGLASAQVAHAIKQAFARAVTGLSPRQRNFLRHAHVDQLTLDQIAATYAIHRATVARTLAQARETLVATTRRELAGLVGVPEDALNSVVRAADSRIDLSLSRVLAAPDTQDEPG
jgi:RNA polymerase sigma-70 factor (ECF subfamily)